MARSSRSKVRFLAFAAAGGLAVAGSAVAHVASASDQPTGKKAQLFDVPFSVQPPAGLTQLGVFDVSTGTQNYTCQGGTFANSPATPEAQLVEAGGRTIHHFGGPSWRLNDGSTVTAAKQTSANVNGAVPQLLLVVTSHSGPSGGLTRVSFIQRLNTSGGLAPQGGCADGQVASVPYKATYVLLGQ